jgi:hypothetical protein
MKRYTVKTPFETTQVTISVERYANNDSLALQLWCEDGPFATLTVNIKDKMAGADRAFVDTNDCPWAPSFIEANNLGRFTGYYGFSGRCAYPLYQFDIESIKA